MMIIADIPLGDRSKARAFTLVELLVVIAIIGILAGLLMPVLISGRVSAYKTASKNNLRSIVTAAQIFGDERKTYPWPREVAAGAPAGELSTEEEALAALALLYRHGYLDDPGAFVAPGSLETAAEPIYDANERRSSFRLEPGQCSYTWRRRLTRATDDSKAPIAAEKPPLERGASSPLGGLSVGMKGGHVVFFDDELLQGPGNADVKRAKAELIGWERVGGGR